MNPFFFIPKDFDSQEIRTADDLEELRKICFELLQENSTLREHLGFLETVISKFQAAAEP